MSNELDVAPTTYLQVGSGMVEVSSLSKELRAEVRKLDKFRQDKLDLMVELEKITLAITAKEHFIKHAVENAVVAQQSSKIEKAPEAE